MGLPNVMQNAAFDLAMKVAGPLIIGFVTPFIVDLIKKANKWLDKAPAYIKQSVAIAVAALATGLTHLLGVPLPADLAAWDTEVIKVLVAGFLAIAIKQHKQLRK